MKTAFTPGPWVLLPEEHDRPYIRIRGAQLGGRYKIANVLGCGYEGAHQREADETRANALAIAALPDLLAALQAMLAESTTRQSIELDIWSDAQYAARAAIAKATGSAV